jgi:predicted dehydrogenase
MGQIYSRHLAFAVPSARLAGVTDLLESSRIQMAAALNVPGFADFAEMLPLVDAVVIATPTSTHCALVEMAAAAGKAIFCEKPSALSLAETDRMAQAVEQAGVPFQIGFMRRFDRGYQAAKQKIAQGAIGQPVTIRAISRDPYRTSLEYADPNKSGGILIDMTIHDVDICQWLMGAAIERVYARGGALVYPELAEVGDVDNALALVDFVGGGLGFLEASRNARYGYDIQCEIIGSEGALRVGYLQETPVLHLTPAGAQHDVVPYFMERFGNAYAAQIEDFANAVQQGRPPQVGLTEARQALQVCIAATHSLRQGRPVTVSQATDLAAHERRLLV